MWLIKSLTCYKLMYFINVDCKCNQLGLQPHTVALCNYKFQVTKLESFPVQSHKTSKVWQ